MIEAPFFTNDGAGQVLVLAVEWKVTLITNPGQVLARHSTLEAAQECARALASLGHRVTIVARELDWVSVPQFSETNDSEVPE